MSVEHLLAQKLLCLQPLYTYTSLTMYSYANKKISKTYNYLFSCVYLIEHVLGMMLIRFGQMMEIKCYKSSD